MHSLPRLPLKLLLLVQLTHVVLSQISLVPLSLKGTFRYIGETRDNSTSSSEQCASKIQHNKVSLYRGIDKTNRTAVVWGIRYRDLQVNDAQCTSSSEAETATVLRVTQDRIFFVFGQDNSPRVCGNFRPSWPSRYFFVDDMPAHLNELMESGLINPGQDNSSEIVSAQKGDLFMLTQAFPTENGDVLASKTICLYLLENEDDFPDISGEDEGNPEEHHVRSR